MGLIIISVVVVSYIYFSYREKKELNDEVYDRLRMLLKMS